MPLPRRLAANLVATAIAAAFAGCADESGVSTPYRPTADVGTDPVVDVPPAVDTAVDVVDPNACAPDGAVEQRPLDCPCGDDGLEVRVCSGGQWGDWFESTGCTACACEPGEIVDARTVSCGDGCDAGERTETRTCDDAGGVGDWDTSGECVPGPPTCTAGDVDTTTVDGVCAPFEQTRECDPATCDWGPWQGDDPARLCEAPGGGALCDGETFVERCTGAANDVTWRCDAATGDLVRVSTIFGCTVRSGPGAGTRVCPGGSFTRRCEAVEGGTAQVTYTCGGSSEPGDGGGGILSRDTVQSCATDAGPVCPGTFVAGAACDDGGRPLARCADDPGEGGALTPLADLPCGDAPDVWEPLHDGVELRRAVVDGVRWTTLRVDLCAVGVRIRATTPDDRGQRTSDWRAAEGLLAAMSGGPFRDGFVPDACVAIGGGEVWADGVDGGSRGTIGFGPGVAAISPPETFDRAPWPAFPGVEDAVCGGPLLVQGGAVATIADRDIRARSGVGLADDGTLVWMTARGSGVGFDDFARAFVDLGIDTALELQQGDGVAMATARDGLVSGAPVGGEAVVANHLGVYIEADPTAHHCAGDR